METPASLRRAYAEGSAFPIPTADELAVFFRHRGVDPRGTEQAVFHLESLSHHPQAELLELFSLMGLSPTDLVLEPGCGNGAPTRLLAKTRCCRVEAFDLCPEQVVKAAGCDLLAAVEGRVRRAVADVHAFEAPEGAFDAVFHNESECHWLDKPRAYASLARALKRGGVMGFHTWGRGDRGGVDDADGDLARLYPKGIWAQSTLSEAAALLESSGFTVTRAEDTTDAVDAGLRARLRELELYRPLMDWYPEEYSRKVKRYFEAMLPAHRLFVRYLRFVCVRR